MSQVYHHIVCKTPVFRLFTEDPGPRTAPRHFYYPADRYTSIEAVADARETERLPGEIVIHAGLEYA